MLDIGTGSGILAIAALKLGAAVAEGVDIDPVAVRTAGENAALNGVQDKLTVLVGDLSDKASGKYDIITANIVANAILSGPAVPGLMAEGCHLYCQRHHRQPQGRSDRRSGKGRPCRCGSEGEAGWECIVCKKCVISQDFFISWLALSVLWQNRKVCRTAKSLLHEGGGKPSGKESPFTTVQHLPPKG